MVGTLIESRHHVQRRAGGATLSVAVHSAVITAAILAGARAAPPRPARPAIVAVTLHAPRPVASAHAPASQTRSNVQPSIHVPVVNVPRVPFDPTLTKVPSFSIAPAVPGRIDIAPAGAGIASIIGADPGDGSPGGTGQPSWRGGELLMHILRSSVPRYPEVLRQAGIDGHVLVRFVVDTNGRVDPRNIQVVQSTNDQFTAAVRAALQNFRFTPSVVRGQRVAALAEMPFEFTISGP